MQWSEIRERYPRQWLLVEAVEAHSEDRQRILDDIEVLQTFQDSLAAMNSYKKVHLRNPQREMYVLHTDRQQLDIGEIYLLSPRTLS
jgi:hypothetical protein